MFVMSAEQRCLRRKRILSSKRLRYYKYIQRSRYSMCIVLHQVRLPYKRGINIVRNFGYLIWVGIDISHHLFYHILVTIYACIVRFGIWWIMYSNLVCNIYMWINSLPFQNLSSVFKLNAIKPIFLTQNEVQITSCCPWSQYFLGSK